MEVSTKPFCSCLTDFAPLEVVFRGLKVVSVTFTHLEKGDALFNFRVLTGVVMFDSKMP